MTFHGSANGGVHAPGSSRDEPISQCCAKCRRGIKGFGELPCGYHGACPNDCHRERGAK